MYGCINIIKTKQAHSPGYPVYVPMKRVKLCKILNPFIFLIMFIDHRQFNDLVQIEYKVDNLSLIHILNGEQERTQEEERLKVLESIHPIVMQWEL